MDVERERKPMGKFGRDAEEARMSRERMDGWNRRENMLVVFTFRRVSKKALERVED